MRTMIPSSSGKIHLSVVICLALAIGFSASAYLNYQQNQWAMADKSALQSKISTLSQQLETTKDKASPSPSPSVAGSSNMSISEFGVKLTTTDPITDLTYAPVQAGSNSSTSSPTSSSKSSNNKNSGTDITAVGFTSQKLLAKYPDCKPGAALGTLSRRSSTQAPSSLKFIKAVGSYAYYFAPSYQSCATDQAGRDALAAARAALLNGILPTISN